MSESGSYHFSSQCEDASTDSDSTSYMVPEKKRRDPIWEGYEEVGNNVHRCKICQVTIKTTKGTKSGLVAHFAFHMKRGETVNKEEFRGWLIGSLVSVLKIPCQAFNTEIMEVVALLSRIGPVSGRIARRITDEETQRVKMKLKSDLLTLRKSGAVLVLTADEWSWQRKRFLGVTLHCSNEIPEFGKSINLMKRFTGRADAETLEAVLLELLTDLGLQSADISGITTDAASVMRKLGQKLKERVAPRPFYHQLCIAHAIHLAVLDVLEGRNNPRGFLPKDEEESSAQKTPPLVGLDEDEEESDPYTDVEDCEDDAATVKPEEGSIGEIVHKIRLESRRFQKSPALNDELLQLAIDCRLKIVTDVRVRWNSTLRMIRNFIAQEEALRKFYRSSRKRGRFPLTSKELLTAKEIISALSHVELCVKRLSLAEANLWNADMALLAMLRKLKSESTNISKMLYDRLSIRILQRRSVASKCCTYIQDRAVETDLDLWLQEVKENIEDDGENALLNTFADFGSISDEIQKFLPTVDSVVTPSEPEDQAADDDYDASLRRARLQKAPKAISVPDLMIQHENGFETLPAAFSSTINSVQPTSVPCERLFSRARHARRFCQERLDDDRFSDRIFLENYYMSSQPWKNFKAKYLSQKAPSRE